MAFQGRELLAEKLQGFPIARQDRFKAFTDQSLYDGYATRGVSETPVEGSHQDPSMFVDVLQNVLND